MTPVDKDCILQCLDDFKCLSSKEKCTIKPFCNMYCYNKCPNAYNREACCVDACQMTLPWNFTLITCYDTCAAGNCASTLSNF